jgi:hypothetical protein
MTLNETGFPFALRAEKRLVLGPLPARDPDLALKRGLDRRTRRRVLGRPRPDGRQVERDFVVDKEADDLRGVLGFLDRLAVEEASPLLEGSAPRSTAKSRSTSDGR